MKPLRGVPGHPDYFLDASVELLETQKRLLEAALIDDELDPEIVRSFAAAIEKLEGVIQEKRRVAKLIGDMLPKSG